VNALGVVLRRGRKGGRGRRGWCRRFFTTKGSGTRLRDDAPSEKLAHPLSHQLMAVSDMPVPSNLANCSATTGRLK